ncbi:MAG: tRNA preQ1(34) S-adenosylmethionine ribosyltransferase-isomerase QueA [Anaerolineales bacterium]|jgi:S-adenosylmethionine:tRNA ribosyltransferase-isomerase
MRLSEFDYDLPRELIAQSPAEPRDSSRLLVLRRGTGEIEHRAFRDVRQLLCDGDLLVFNDTKVIPARMRARKLPQGGQVELLLLAKREEGIWEALVRGKHVVPGGRLALVPASESNRQPPPQEVQAEILEDLGEGRRLVRFSSSNGELLSDFGRVPLPPYIHQPLRDPDRYQTVFARAPGSAAAPTAGLHFTLPLLRDLQGQGVQFAFVTLHVGLDTFRPITEAEIEQHKLHSEWVKVSSEVVESVRKAHRAGRKVIAVGTTSVRALETAARTDEGPGDPGSISAWEGQTSLYITPGFSFRVVDGLITNFHLPRSSLLVMVSAFAGKEPIREAYRQARDMRYRFYSFGDAMMIL